MARLTDQDKKLILADYFTGAYSQRELAKKHNVSLGTISKLTKDHNEQNEHLVNAKASVIRAEKELPNEQMNAIVNAAHDKVRHENLINGNAELLAKQIQVVVKNFEMEEEDKETGEIKKVSAISSNDVKTLAEANDRLAITLKVAERHAPKMELNNTNAQQNNNLSREEVMQAVAEVLPN